MMRELKEELGGFIKNHSIQELMINLDISFLGFILLYSTDSIERRYGFDEKKFKVSNVDYNDVDVDDVHIGLMFEVTVPNIWWMVPIESEEVKDVRKKFIKISDELKE